MIGRGRACMGTIPLSASMPYRDTAAGAADTAHAVYIYYTSLALDPTRTAMSITVPIAGTGTSALHIFAMAIGTPTN